ncbi:Single-stranded DNA-binding protein [Bacteroidales bacterium CF]|jgi:single stranded DNA-binding protein (ssb)|nr:Single-stranded DNA-binding protein [Bacteroidales bacterium CF]
MSLNKVMLIGNVGKDPEIRHLENDSVVANFTLATTERYRDKNGNWQEQTEWHNIVCWRLLAERAEKYVKKGSQVFVEGKIRSREWVDQTEQKRSVIEIVAESFQLLGKKTDSQPSVQNIQPVTTSAAVVGDDLPDDLPF